MLDIVAEKLGLERDELVEQLKDGKTVAELADEKGVALDDIVDAIVEGAAERLAEAVADGKLTQEEADAKLAEMRDRLVDQLSQPFEPGDGHPGPGGKHGPGRGHRGAMLDIVAEKLGLERDALLEQLEGGKTVAELADEQGVALEDIVDAILEPVAERLAQAVADGRMTQDEADEKLAKMRANLIERMSEPFEPGDGGPGRGPGGGGKGPGGGGL
jgi:uncharacterized protein (DUF433 family)